ncbi:hypothetical protein ACIPC2_00130 [Curtobacterium pusillum]|uniref:hypothetical protein n=1 Tax=Curtobacterium pusillum TaxID=69373 RepID=UPI00380D1335
MPYTQSPSAQAKRGKRFLAIVLLVLIVLVPVGIIGGGTVLKSYDSANRMHPTCTVRSAHSGIDSSRSLKGVGSSTAQVVFETADCGTLVLLRGVTRDNQERVAASVSPGVRYTFDVGAGSFRMHDFLNAIKQAVYVKKFDRADATVPRR